MDIIDRDQERIGRLLTRVTAVAGLFLIVPIGLYGLLVMALIGPDELRHGGGGLGCFSEACVRESHRTALACFGVVALGIALMALARHSTRRSFFLAAVGGVLASLVASVIMRDQDSASVLTLVVPAIPALFGLGSWLRFTARRPRPHAQPQHMLRQQRGPGAIPAPAAPDADAAPGHEAGQP